MRTYDLTPLFRSTVGFDRLSNLFDTAFGSEEGNGYPPYNIEKTGTDAYRVTMAVAGFGEKDLTVTAQENMLVVTGRVQEPREAERQFLYRGIAARAFERKFSLADHIRVAGAALQNGLLNVDLVREVPEAMKPKQIKITTKGSKEPEVIEGSKSAA